MARMVVASNPRSRNNRRAVSTIRSRVFSATLETVRLTPRYGHGPSRRSRAIPGPPHDAPYESRGIEPGWGCGSSRESGELGGHQRGDLGRVEGRALAQVVPAHEQVQRVREVERLADPADVGRV